MARLFWPLNLWKVQLSPSFIALSFTCVVCFVVCTRLFTFLWSAGFSVYRVIFATLQAWLVIKSNNECRQKTVYVNFALTIWKVDKNREIVFCQPLSILCAAAVEMKLFCFDKGKMARVAWRGKISKRDPRLSLIQFWKAVKGRFLKKSFKTAKTAHFLWQIEGGMTFRHRKMLSFSISIFTAPQTAQTRHCNSVMANILTNLSLTIFLLEFVIERQIANSSLTTFYEFYICKYHFCEGQFDIAGLQWLFVAEPNT